MRWFAASVIAVAVAWAVYVASPYWALRGLAAAVEAGNVEEVAARVNFRALRHALSRHLVSDLTAADRTGALGTPDAQLAAAAIAAAANPLVEQLLTPEGVVFLLRGGASGRRDAADVSAEAPAEVQPPFAGGARTFERLSALMSASSWRGFRNVYFTLPLDGPRASRFRLQLRLSRLHWRLVSVELPSDVRRRIALEAVGLRRSP